MATHHADVSVSFGVPADGATGVHRTVEPRGRRARVRTAAHRARTAAYTDYDSSASLRGGPQRGVPAEAQAEHPPYIDYDVIDTLIRFRRRSLEVGA